MFDLAATLLLNSDLMQFLDEGMLATSAILRRWPRNVWEVQGVRLNTKPWKGRHPPLHTELDDE